MFNGNSEVNLYNEKLWTCELFWRDHYDWLKSKGYLLRPRFHPDWVPSWVGTSARPRGCEDSQSQLLIPHNLDAIRVADGKPVMLRIADAPSISDELKIGRIVSSKDMRSDPRNHCIPTYDRLEIPKATDEGKTCIVVMPYLVAWDKVDFQTVGEVIDFCSQVFEGLQFMHNQNIAHNDAKNNNIMMDWDPLYSHPPHFHRPSKRMDWKGPSKPRNRTFYPVRYYFIDWDLSKQYDPIIRTNRVPMRYPGYGGDRTVPEFKRSELCNPFAVDVYCLGNVIRQKFIEVRRNVGFLRDLIADMTHDDPMKRPTMDEVVTRFEEIRKKLSWWKLRSRRIFSRQLSEILYHQNHQVWSTCTSPTMSMRDRLMMLDGSSEVNPYNEKLWTCELFWRDHYDWLKSKGYLLRPRFHPDWVPSWIRTSAIPFQCEDSQNAPSISDELKIGRLVSSKDMRSDTRNHCIPTYDTLEITQATDEEKDCIVVMPYLVPWDEAEFQTVGEVVDFCNQVFEGLQFMHSQDIAHNDAKNNNIMMDWEPLYSHPPHFHNRSMRMDWKGPSELRNRTLYPVRYYFIDWDLSKKYDPIIRTNRVPMRYPGYGGDRTVPEFKRNELCNPFAVDVYCLGNVIRQKFIEVRFIQLWAVFHNQYKVSLLPLFRVTQTWMIPLDEM
ncbi:hypothetical protein FB446DRAFT_635306 [Lentinula raphanica]|nr:hypothetical protein FB446DRAFT_635306 [Lentinula raphanica]